MAVVVATDDLAIGVGVGVLTACALFARRVAHLVSVEAGPVADGTRTYRVRGALFFASSNDLVGRFDYAGDPGHVVVDLSGGQVWDASSVAALDAVEHEYAARGTAVELVGLTADTDHWHRRLTGTLGAGH